MNDKKGSIIFVHGAWHGKWCWEKYFRKEFENNGYEVITFDLPGHDKSGKIKGINKYSIGDYVVALKEQVSKLKKPPIIVGHSMGGLIVQKYLESASCEKAILLASVPPYGVINATLKFSKKPYFLPSVLGLNLYRLVNSEKKSLGAFFSDSLSKHELTEYTNALCSESFKAFLGMLFPRIKKSEHSNIPMLVIGAEHDTIFSINDNHKTATLYGADIEIMKDLAHDVMLDTNHQKVSQKMLDWLA